MTKMNRRRILNGPFFKVSEIFHGPSASSKRSASSISCFILRTAQSPWLRPLPKICLMTSVASL